MTRSQVWNSWSPGCQGTSPNREIPAMLVRPCIQNALGNNGKLSPSGYSLHPRKSGPEFLQGPCLVPSWCGATRTIWNCCWSWGISCPPRDAVPDGFLYCFCLLAESYEIIKHYHSTPTEKWPRVRPRTRWCVTTSSTLLGPILVWSEQNYLKLLLTVRNFVDREEEPSYVSSAMHPECPRKEWRTKSFKLQSNFHWRLV